MTMQNRVIGLEYFKGPDLRPHPKNPRKHPQSQIRALAGVLQQVGIADALVVYRAEDGVPTIIDGHCRGENWQDVAWPCIVLDVTDAEAEVILATHDPLAGMAEVDAEKMQRLLDSVEIECAEMLEALQAVKVDDDIPADNKDIDEDSLSQTSNECPKCGFAW